MRRPNIIHSRIFSLLLLFLAPWALTPNPAWGGEKAPVPLRMGDRDSVLLLKINRSVCKGFESLIGHQNSDGSWKGVWSDLPGPYRFSMGETALALLTLLKCGMPRHDRCIEEGFDWLRKQPLRKICEVGVLIMALEAKGNLLRQGQGRGRKRMREPSPADLGWMKECVRFLLEHRIPSGRLRRPGKNDAPRFQDVWGYPSGAGDHLNTLFALLGLHSASLSGIEIPEGVWILTIKHFLEAQEDEGPEVQRWKTLEDKKTGLCSYRRIHGPPDRSRGWAYQAGKEPWWGGSERNLIPTGSMTCAGITCLVVALSELGRNCPPARRARAEESIRDGLAWLDRNWDIRRNPGHPLGAWHYFFLANLHFASWNAWTRSIGKHDWYREGAEFLIAHQKEDGSWDDPNCPDALANTCFAMLFLARETVPPPGRPRPRFLDEEDKEDEGEFVMKGRRLE